MGKYEYNITKRTSQDSSEVVLKPIKSQVIIDNDHRGSRSSKPSLRSLVEQLVASVQGIATDVQGLKSDVQILKTDMQDVKTRLSNVETRLDRQDEFNEVVRDFMKNRS
jgi:outer membrane murein-binding lipoprotein Lpp